MKLLGALPFFFTLSNFALHMPLTPVEEKFLEAARMADLVCLEECLKKNVNINVQDILGQTALHTACIRHKYTIIYRLLNFYNLDLNSQQQEGFTPLYSFCLTYILGSRTHLLRNSLPSVKDATQVITTLIKNGAKVDLSNRSGGTLLNFMAGYRKFPKEWMELIIEAGATNKVGEVGMSPLIKALYFCYKNIPLILTIPGLSPSDIIAAKNWNIKILTPHEQPKNDIHYKNGIKILRSYYFTYLCLTKLLKPYSKSLIPLEIDRLIAWHAANEQCKEIQQDKKKIKKEELKMLQILL